MRRLLMSIVIGMVWFICIGFFQYTGQNPEWYLVASTAGFAACVSYFSGYGLGRHDPY